MTKKLFFSIISIIQLLSGFAQTNNLANNYLDFFEEPTKKIAIDVLAFNKHLIINSQKNKAIEIQKHLYDHYNKEKSKFEKKDDYIGQENLKKESLCFLGSIQNYLNSQKIIDYPDVESENYHADSVYEIQKSLISNLDLLCKASIQLHEEHQNFCLVNRIPNRPKSVGINILFLDAIQVVEYCIEINKIVMRTKNIERLFINSLGKDTGNKPDEIRKAIIHSAEEGTLKLKGLLAHKNDRFLKKSALNSLRLYRMEAASDFLQLLNFRKIEQNFYKHHFETKEKVNLNEKEKERYRKAVADYNTHIKAANEIIRNSEEKRFAHEKEYDMAYQEYIEEMLTIRY